MMNKDIIDIRAARIAKELPRISAKIAAAEVQLLETQILLVTAMQELEELYLSLDTEES